MTNGATVFRSKLISKPALSVAIFFLLATAIAAAQRLDSLPGGPVDSRTMRVQQKVEELYDQGEYRRALFIYENELAPLGDKYAQYMVGYIHLTGAGVPEDAVAASAWYRLAAERSNPLFVAVRDELMRALGDVERGQSDVLYSQLRKKYSDPVILLDLIRNDLEQTGSRTGSRISRDTSPVMIVDPRTGLSISAEAYDRQLRRRIQARVDFLVRELDLELDSTDPARLDVDALARAVDEFVATLPDY